MGVDRPQGGTEISFAGGAAHSDLDEARGGSRCDVVAAPDRRRGRCASGFGLGCSATHHRDLGDRLPARTGSSACLSMSTACRTPRAVSWRACPASTLSGCRITFDVPRIPDGVCRLGSASDEWKFLLRTQVVLNSSPLLIFPTTPGNHMTSGPFS